MCVIILYLFFIFQIRSLSDRNVNPVIGACTDPTKICILTLYCSKGSLQDVLENDNIKLDRIFKVSFASDIAKVRIDVCFNFEIH